MTFAAWRATKAAHCFKVPPPSPHLHACLVDAPTLYLSESEVIVLARWILKAYSNQVTFCVLRSCSRYWGYFIDFVWGSFNRIPVKLVPYLSCDCLLNLPQRYQISNISAYTTVIYAMGHLLIFKSRFAAVKVFFGINIRVLITCKLKVSLKKTALIVIVLTFIILRKM